MIHAVMEENGPLLLLHLRKETAVPGVLLSDPLRSLVWIGLLAITSLNVVIRAV